MAVEYVRRGEIYRVRLDTGVGSEQGVTRPALIISNNSGNSSSPLVIVAYMTTKDHNIGIHYGPTKATGVPSYVQCEQIYTVHKSRLIHLMGSLSENEMRDVDSRLDEVLDLGWVDDAPLKEKEQTINALKLQLEELKSEVFSLKTSLSGKEDEILTRDVEIAVHKRMYEKAVGIIAAMKAEPDLPKPPKYVQEIEQVNAVEVSPKKPEEPKKPKSVEPKLVDINTATFSQLRGIGMSNNLVLSVINGRPYKKIEDLKKISGLNNKIYGLVEKKICCVPVVVEELPVPPVEQETTKLNINTASVEDFVRIGFGKYTARDIVSYRSGHGDFGTVEDLRKISRVGNGSMKKLGHLLEV